VDENGCTKDSDGDGVNDCKDRCPNTKPGAKVNADGCEVGGIERCTVITLASDVTFGFNKFDLTPQARIALDQLEPQIIASLNAGTIDIVSVVGHTDSVGTDQYNQKLSEKRANSVRSYLMSKGIPTNKIVAIGKGEKEPVADNKTKEGRAQNRRVEIRFDSVATGSAASRGNKDCTTEQRRRALGVDQPPAFIK
jgi:OOP family OmpA-OmpF porin